MQTENQIEEPTMASGLDAAIEEVKAHCSLQAGGPLIESLNLVVHDSLRKSKRLREVEAERDEALKWKEEDPRMLREQCRVADVAFQHLHEQHKKANEELSRLRAELETAKADRNKAALQERQKYLPMLEQLKDENKALRQQAAQADELYNHMHDYADERDKLRADMKVCVVALKEIYEWYDLDGSVGGAFDPFEDNRKALATMSAQAALKEGK